MPRHSKKRKRDRYDEGEDDYLRKKIRRLEKLMRRRRRHDSSSNESSSDSSHRPHREKWSKREGW